MSIEPGLFYRKDGEAMSITLDADLASEIAYGNISETIEDGSGKVIYKIEQDEDWSGGGKYQTKETIFSDNDGNFFSLRSSRSGSHFTDWNVDHELDCPQVFRKERVITEVYYE